MPGLPSVLLAFVMSAGVATAQFSGTYTVDPQGSGPRTYADARALTLDLSRQGVSGPVVVEFVTGIYLYACPVVPIPNASATNTITFKSKVLHGADFRTTSAAANVPGNGFQLSGFSSGLELQHVIIDGFTFSSTTGNNRASIRSRSYTSDIEIKNCEFLDMKLEATSVTPWSRNWHIHDNKFMASVWNMELELEGFDVHHNWFQYSAGRSPIELDGGRDPRHRGRFYNNLVSGGADVAVSLKYAGNVDVEHNTIVASAGSCITVDGRFGLWNEINNNLLVCLSTSPALLLQHETPFTYFLDGNLFWSASTKKIVLDSLNNSYDLGQWQARGQDTHSLFGDPKIDSASMKLKPGSLAVQKAWMTKAYVVDDYAGVLRPSKATIGAFETDIGATFKLFGAGCAGEGGKVPRMGVSGDLKIGSTNLTIVVTNARGGGLVPAVLIIGASNSVWNGVPLPFSFGGACQLLASPDVLANTTLSGFGGPGGGYGTVAFPIPNNPNLKGAKIHFQWGVVDPMAQGVGIAFSEGATLGL